MSRVPLRTAVAAAMCLVWGTAIGAGLAVLWRYSATPGPAAAAPTTWPRAATVERDSRRPTLIVFTHPYCGCSRATVAELARLVARVGDRTAVRVLVYRPSDAPDGGERTDLWTSAAAIPGVRVSTDADAREAAAFGAVVSGQTLLYDAAGRLVFSGGITAARGHEGDNSGRSAIEALVLHGMASASRTPVFGCFLREVPL